MQDHQFRDSIANLATGFSETGGVGEGWTGFAVLLDETIRR
jgi:hypothetical protein